MRRKYQDRPMAMGAVLFQQNVMDGADCNRRQHPRQALIDWHSMALAFLETTWAPFSTPLQDAAGSEQALPR